MNPHPLGGASPSRHPDLTSRGIPPSAGHRLATWAMRVLLALGVILAGAAIPTHAAPSDPATSIASSSGSSTLAGQINADTTGIGTIGMGNTGTMGSGTTGMGNTASGNTTATGTEPTDSTESGDASTSDVTVFIGASGLSWTDVSPEYTPAIASLAEDGIGALVVRSRRAWTCPYDGWLAINTGTRVADLPNRPCRIPTEPLGDQVRHWSDFTESVAEQNYPAQLGLLRETIPDLATFGPGAAVAGADAEGTLQDHTPLTTPQELSAAIGQSTASLLIVDPGTIFPRADSSYEEQLDQIEANVAAVLDGLQIRGESATIVLAGIGDSGEAPRLRVLAISGGAFDSTEELTSPSTRQPGYALTTDLLSTLAVLTGTPVPGSPNLGQAVVGTGPTDATPDELIASAIDRDVHARAMPRVGAPFYIMFVTSILVLFVVFMGSLHDPTVRVLTRRMKPETAHTLRRRILRVLSFGGVFAASIPVATFFANLYPWWRAGSPGYALLFASLIIAGLITAVALLGPWRRSPVGPVGFIGFLTAGLLCFDVVTGSRLHTAALMGTSPLFGGRFYGMNNTTYILTSVGAILLAMAVGYHLIKAGRRRWAGVAALVIGAIVTIIDGAPSWGADFGGPPSMIPAFLILALLLMGVKITWKRLSAVGLFTLVAVTLVAFADWLRPADSRSHLGNFFQNVLDGDLLRVIEGKLRQNLGVLWNNVPLTILAICGVLLLLWISTGPLRSAASGHSHARWFSGDGNQRVFSDIRREVPTIGPAVLAILTVSFLGMLVNDSGIIIPATGIALAAPSLIAVTATWALAPAPPPRHPVPLSTSASGGQAVEGSAASPVDAP